MDAPEETGKKVDAPVTMLLRRFKSCSIGGRWLAKRWMMLHLSIAFSRFPEEFFASRKVGAPLMVVVHTLRSFEIRERESEKSTKYSLQIAECIEDKLHTA